jgi:nitrogen fixation/metabolism regulation signal transduction histidine kinase
MSARFELPVAQRGWRWPLAARLSLWAVLLAALAISLALGVAHFYPQNIVLAGAVSLALMLPVCWLVIRSQLQPLLAIFRALGGTVISYKDGDYSFSLHWPRNDELAELVDAHNALGHTLREQRLDLVQRELLLDTMVQNTPVAMLLVREHGAIVFANIAARQLLNDGRRLEGRPLEEVVQEALPSLREALDRGGDGLFTVNAEHEEEEQVFHLARRSFHLNGRAHELLLLRHLTAELRRQEVQTWKKVIRVISHELNNSLAPVASLAHSGMELLKRGQHDRLPQILQTMEERARHLESFIAGYARFAKLPAPRLEQGDWTALTETLRAQIAFTVNGDLPQHCPHFDVAQMEQALLNLLKNAHESGSPPEQVSLSVRSMEGVVRVEVSDRGSGMSETVMANALVPFYSTKRSGTGLGLALAREIAEAHNGRIALSNREGGGLSVALILPQ